MAFIKWVKSTAVGSEWADEIHETVREKSKQDGHIYLIPPLDGDDELDRVIDQKSVELLSNELIEWQVDPEVWPEHLSNALLRQWFTVAYSEMVFNMVNGETGDLVDFLADSKLQSTPPDPLGITPL